MPFPVFYKYFSFYGIFCFVGRGLAPADQLADLSIIKKRNSQIYVIPTKRSVWRDLGTYHLLRSIPMRRSFDFISFRSG